MGAIGEPAFRSIAIVGLGLIGGSVALAVRERWPSVRIVGLDHASVIAHAIGSGAIDRAASGVTDLGAPDLIVLAAPVLQNVNLLAQLAPHTQPPTIVTDVGGTKREIVKAARALSLTRSFIGGHPLGGAERGGFGFARPDLFAGRPWIFTPDEPTAPEPLEQLRGFARGLGAKPASMDADRHDRLMAFVSHLPQLTATALMEVVGEAAGTDGLRMAGRGLIDTTRLASSPSSVWRDISLTNADEIGRALDLMIERLTELRSDLGRGSALESVFDKAARWRADLVKPRD